MHPSPPPDRAPRPESHFDELPSAKPTLLKKFGQEEMLDESLDRVRLTRGHGPKPFVEVLALRQVLRHALRPSPKTMISSRQTWSRSFAKWRSSELR